VFLGADGTAVTGRHAQRSARSDPARYEPNPKRCIDDGSLLLGEATVPVVDVIAIVLRRVLDEAVRVGGGPPDRTVLTHPAGWGPRRRQVLVAAAKRIGLEPLELLPEPLAAAA
jgi:molecular chaperone DnaK (HSP70)